MAAESTELDQLQHAYKVAVENWVAAIRREESLASGDHSIAEIDTWEGASFEQQRAGDEAKEAKQAYEDALRKRFFNF